MAHHKSAIRQHKRSLRRYDINMRNKSTLRTAIRTLRAAIEENKAEEAKAMLPKVVSTIDRSVKKGVIQKNTGSRYKSRLSRQVVLLNPKAAK